MKRIEVERLRDSIKSRYDIDNEYDDNVEELLIKYYENGKIGW